MKTTLPAPLLALLVLPWLDLCDATARRIRQRAPFGQSLALAKRTPSEAWTVDDWGTWAKNEKTALEAKYGAEHSKNKRSSGTNQ